MRMSRSFRESYLGLCFKPTRGWYAGKLRQGARRVRRRLSCLCDEDGTPILPKHASVHKWWAMSHGRVRILPDNQYGIVIRNGRKYRLLLKPNVGGICGFAQRVCCFLDVDKKKFVESCNESAVMEQEAGKRL